MRARPFPLSATVLLLATAAGAQDQPRTLAELRQHMQARLEQARGADDRFAAIQAALTEQVGLLRLFLAEHAKGSDAHNGRLMLVDTLMNLGRRDDARAALAEFDAASASPMVTLAGAELATALGMDEQRRSWIDAALDKDAPFDERMAVGVHLMSAMREVDKAEALFARELAAAGDDEQRARVRWHRLEAVREREDRSDDLWFEELRRLAKDLPDTYWGGVAADRVRATEHAVGKPPVPLTLDTGGGGKLRLADLAGKVVVLSFWATWSDRSLAVEQHLVGLWQRHQDDGLMVVGVNLDDDAEACRAHLARHPEATWPQVCEGKGFHSDPALRYGIETVPDLMVIGRDGNIVAQHLLPVGDADLAQLDAMVQAALEAGGGR